MFDPDITGRTIVNILNNSRDRYLFQNYIVKSRGAHLCGFMNVPPSGFDVLLEPFRNQPMVVLLTITKRRAFMQPCECTTIGAA